MNFLSRQTRASRLDTGPDEAFAAKLKHWNVKALMRDVCARHRGVLRQQRFHMLEGDRSGLRNVLFCTQKRHVWTIKMRRNIEMSFHVSAAVGARINGRQGACDAGIVMTVTVEVIFEGDIII